MDKVLAVLSKKTAILDPIGEKIPPVHDFAKKQGVNSGLLVGAVLFVVGLVLLLLQGWQILVLSLTVLYPGLHSIRAIESEGKDDDKVWLTYWMVFGLYTVVDTFFGFLFYFVPYWDWIKMGLFIWLLLPQFNGAQIIYESVLRKLLTEHKDLIRDLIKRTHSLGAKVASDAKAAASDPQNIASAMSAAASAQAKLSEVQVEKTDSIEAAEN